MKIKELVLYSSIAAIYIVLTVLLGSFSFGPIQFRIAEALVLLCFFNRKFFIPLTLACLISNLMSPFGLYDVLFGTTATILSLLFIMCSKRLWVASIYPVIFNGVIVSFEICLMEGIFDLNMFAFNMVTIMLGEFVCVSIIGVILFTTLKKNRSFMKLINE